MKTKKFSEEEKQNLLDQTMTCLIGASPFFAALISQFRCEEWAEEFVAAVGVKNGRIYLYYNPDQFFAFPIKQRIAILEHECLHLVMEHITRRQERNQMLFNVACDVAINQYIQNLPKDAVTLETIKQLFGLSLAPNLTAEDYYDQLKKKCNENSGNAKMSGASSDQKMEQLVSSQPGSHDKWEQGETDGNGGVTNLDPEFTKEILKVAVGHAKEEVEKRGHGHIPTHLQQMLDNLFKPSCIPWQQMLKRWVGSHIRNGHKLSWKRPNRRFGDIYKGKLVSRTLRVSVAFDTSGSISNGELNMFMSELKAIQGCYKSDIDVYECDAEIAHEYKLRPSSTINTNIHGRGGTSFIPVFDRIAEKGGTDLLIYFTDLEGDFPEKPRYQTLWVTVPTAYKTTVPFGEVLPLKNHGYKHK